MVSSDIVDERLRRLTLAQKVRLLTGRTVWRTYAEPAIGLAEIVTSDGPVGVRGERWDERDTAINIPSPTALAATWDPALVTELGALLGADARRKGVHVLLAPTVNLHRSPLGGRHFECMSEDPLLTARIGAGYVQGVQSQGVAATAKHYVANDAETERFTVDNRIDERTLHELYLAPFEALVRADVWLVMSAYNSVNGATMSENPLLLDPLKRAWGFDGVVVSDWTAVRSTVDSARAAQDLVMPGPVGPWGDALLDAVLAGQVEESVIDDKVRRLLLLAVRVGRLDGVTPSVAESPPVPGARPVVRAAAAAGMVLLRNEPVQGVPLLPLVTKALTTIALIGANALTPRIQGGGSAGVYPRSVVSPMAGIQAVVGEQVRVLSAIGARLHDLPLPLTPADAADPLTGEPGLRVRMFDEQGAELLNEHRGSGKLQWLDDPIAARAADIEVAADLLVDITGRWTVTIGGEGEMRLWVGDELVVHDELRRNTDGHAAAVLGPAHATHEVDLNAGQRVRLVARYRPYRDGNPMHSEAIWLAARRPHPSADVELAEAVRIAAEADVAVVVVGTTDEVESEGFDRTSIDLPGRQDELVAAVAAANPRTVVVVNSGSPVALPWREQVGAVLLSWFPGQEFGDALADVLFGAREPGGRLPTTWAARGDDLPVWQTTPKGGQLDYAEGLHIGYRAWARGGPAPAYPFGFGLGYTTWSVSNLEVVPGQPVTLRVALRNTGARSGRQVVQAYLSLPGSAVERPVRWLAGFASATLPAWAEQRVEIALDRRLFEHWDTTEQDWVLEPGTYTVQVGFSSADLPLRADIPIG